MVVLAFRVDAPDGASVALVFSVASVASVASMASVAWLSGLLCLVELFFFFFFLLFFARLATVASLASQESFLCFFTPTVSANHGMGVGMQAGRQAAQDQWLCMSSVNTTRHHVHVCVCVCVSVCVCVCVCVCVLEAGVPAPVWVAVTAVFESRRAHIHPRALCVSLCIVSACTINMPQRNALPANSATDTSPFPLLSN